MVGLPDSSSSQSPAWDRPKEPVFRELATSQRSWWCLLALCLPVSHPGPVHPRPEPQVGRRLCRDGGEVSQGPRLSPANVHMVCCVLSTLSTWGSDPGQRCSALSPPPVSCTPPLSPQPGRHPVSLGEQQSHFHPQCPYWS
jgi:hypothetical protein